MDDIQFNEKTHEYLRNNKQYTSVTTLLKKYNLSADYTGIPKQVLEEAAKKGKFVHKAFEDYIKLGINNDPSLLDPFIAYVNNRKIDLSRALSEEIVYEDTYEIAGTIDFQYQDNGISVIADFKSTSQIHWESVTWQISIYNFIKSKGDIYEYYTKEHKVFWIYNGKFSVRDLPLIDYEEIKKLLTANLLNQPYTYKPDYSKILSDSEETIYTQICKEINEYKTLIEDLERKREPMNNKIKDSMIQGRIHEMTLKDIVIKLSERKGARTLDRTKVEDYMKQHGEDINNYVKVGKDSVNLIVNVKDQRKYTTTIAEDIANLKKDEGV